MHLYPFKFESILKEKIWGGSKIKHLLAKGLFTDKKIGETWELSTIDGSESVVSNGCYEGLSLKKLINIAPKDILGDNILDKYGKDFPLLIKYIDANHDLSVQVHPNDELAKAKHNSKGKTEFWYVMQSDNDSKIYYDLKEGVSKDSFIKAINDNKTLDLINQRIVTEGDFFYIPAGTVHTIGKGNLILEIQQASDITYRIFDFNRKDENGNKRELHVDDALEAINFKKLHGMQLEPSVTNELTNNSYFNISKKDIDNTGMKYENNNQLKVIISIKGKGEILTGNEEERIKIDYSDVILIPSGLSGFTINSKECMKLLIITIN